MRDHTCMKFFQPRCHSVAIDQIPTNYITKDNRTHSIQVGNRTVSWCSEMLQLRPAQLKPNQVMASTTDALERAINVG